MPFDLIGRFRPGLKPQVLSLAETALHSNVVRVRGTIAAGDTAQVRLPNSSFGACRLLKALQETTIGSGTNGSIVRRDPTKLAAYG